MSEEKRPIEAEIESEIATSIKLSRLIAASFSSVMDKDEAEAERITKGGTTRLEALRWSVQAIETAGKFLDKRAESLTAKERAKAAETIKSLSQRLKGMADKLPSEDEAKEAEERQRLREETAKQARERK